MLGLAALRIANARRQAEWDTSGGLDLAYRANELAGEIGEACNVIKKLERARLGIRGSRASVEELAAEIADVVICADLVAMGEGLAFREEDFASTGAAARASLTHVGLELAISGFLVCRDAWWLTCRGHARTGLGCTLDSLIQACRRAALVGGFDLNEAVRAKFNATSEKVGLETRL